MLPLNERRFDGSIGEAIWRVDAQEFDFPVLIDDAKDGASDLEFGSIDHLEFTFEFDLGEWRAERVESLA